MVYEIKERFKLTPEEANHMQEWFRKAENAEVLYCEAHDREWFDFEGDTSPACLEERVDFEQSMKVKADYNKEVIGK